MLFDSIDRSRRRHQERRFRDVRLTNFSALARWDHRAINGALNAHHQNLPGKISSTQLCPLLAALGYRIANGRSGLRRGLLWG